MLSRVEVLFTKTNEIKMDEKIKEELLHFLCYSLNHRRMYIL
jgi:hypothetical protein